GSIQLGRSEGSAGERRAGRLRSGVPSGLRPGAEGVMSTRFRVDLLHPGGDLRQMGWVAQSWAEWLPSPDAPRRLAMFSLSGAAEGCGPAAAGASRSSRKHAPHRGRHTPPPREPTPARGGAVHGGAHEGPDREQALPAGELGDEARPRRGGWGRRTTPEHHHRAGGAAPVRPRALAVTWVLVAAVFLALLIFEFSKWRALSTEVARAGAERQRLTAEIQIKEGQLVSEMRKHSTLVQEMQWTASGSDPRPFLTRLADRGRGSPMG